MDPFVSIPAGAAPFFVSDSYAINVHPGNPWLHHPGAFNQSGLITEPNAQIDVFLLYGEFLLMPQNDQGLIFNVDVDIAVYDVGTGAAVPTGEVATMHPPYGNAPNGKWLNASAGYKLSPKSVRQFSRDTALRLRAKAPGHGGPWQLGARILFFSQIPSPMHCHYSYAIHGAWKQA